MPEPFFIQDGNQQLFAVHHPPETSAGARAVLLCPPGPQEYMTTHWAFRRLAIQLAAKGAHVLRFDYFGTGDSSGDSAEGTLERWQRDIATAAAVLGKLSKTERVSVVGCRLGASMAWLATHSQELRVRDLVLWDPIVVGATYLERVFQYERTTKANSLTYVPLPRPPTELMGFPLPTSQRLALQALDLCAEAPPRATRSHLFVGSTNGETVRLRDHLSASTKRFTFQEVTESAAAGSGRAMTPAMLETIATAISGSCS